MQHSPRALTALGAMLLSLGIACGGREGGWSPVLEETSTEFLAAQVEDALGHLKKVREALPEDTQGASDEAAETEAALRRLADYYLPVLEARESCYNAYRHYLMGDEARTLDELERAEQILLAAGEGQEEFLVHELEDPLEHLSDARLAVAGKSDEAGRLLESLALRLHDMLVKGGLIVR